MRRDKAHTGDADRTSPAARHSGDRILAEARIVAAPLEAAVERACQKAQQHFEVPISLVTLVEHQRPVVKAACGIDAIEMPRDGAFCTYTILRDGVFAIPDMRADEHFRHNLRVADEPHARFYAGAPLIYRRTCAWAPSAPCELLPEGQFLALD